MISQWTVRCSIFLQGQDILRSHMVTSIPSLSLGFVCNHLYISASVRWRHWVSSIVA